MRMPLSQLARSVALAAALVAAAPAFAQAPGAVPPPAPVAPPPVASGGPAVILDRNAGFVHVDVRCTPAETTRACIDLANDLYAKLKSEAPSK